LDPPCPIDWITKEEGSVLHREEEAMQGLLGGEGSRSRCHVHWGLSSSPPLILGEVLENN